MDKNKAIQWGAPIVAHGILWVLAYYLGFENDWIQEHVGSLGSAITSIALVAVSICDSIKGRKKVRQP